MTTTSSRPLFPSYMQMEQRVPLPVWHALRVVSVWAALTVCILLVVWPEAGLGFFWGFFIPVLPLVFLVAPGLWRNVCPMAALNQTPRLLGFTRGLTLPEWLKEYGYVVGIALLFTIIPARKVLFNDNGPALALLLLIALGAAFLMGVLFKGKSGWCSSICPLLPVQRVYGQSPFATVPNSHCRPCVGCTKNCYDFNPAVAYLADLYDDDPHYRAYRTFFAGAFPGLILAFFTLPEPPEISVPLLYGQFAVFIAVSVGSFFLLEAFLKVTTNKITALYGAAAFTLYYWFTIPLLLERLGDSLGVAAPAEFVWALRFAMLALSVVWLLRTYWKEPLFVAQVTASRPLHVGASGALALHRAARAAGHTVTLLPEERQVVAESGRALLEVVESSGARIESGCRMGICGADPVAVVEGMEHLSPAGADECATLERLGLAENTRLACCARVNGPVRVSLKPQPRTAPRTGMTLGAYDRAVRRVVIAGNGIAGVTAADHLRRRHPTCEIHLVGREQHHLYNRMAISRLVYGRSAMQGLYLLPDAWYDEQRITCWLNTRVAAIDTEGRQVRLGTGEALAYDRLILATGSTGRVPPVVGFGMPGTFVLREAEDAIEMRAFVQEHGCRRAVVAGGGLLGLESAYALLKTGLHVTVLERSPWLLRRQLDARGGAFLRHYLEGLGIDVALEAEAAAVEGDEGRVERARLIDGRTLPCDFFLAAAGITPAVELARAAGLAVNRGVLVDDMMRTSAPGIFAAGDVAEHAGQVYGLWPAAVEQAEVAAVNVAGGARRFPGTTPVTILKVAGVDLTSIGRFEPASPAEMVLALEDPREHRYRKLVLSGGRIVGAILLGYPLEAPHVTAAVKDGRDVSGSLDALRAGDWQVLAGAGGVATAV